MGTVAPTGTKGTHMATVIRSASVRMESKSGDPLTAQNATDIRPGTSARGMKQNASAPFRHVTTPAEINDVNKAATESESQRHHMSQYKLRMLIDIPGQSNRYTA